MIHQISESPTAPQPQAQDDFLNRPLDTKKFQVSRQDPRCPEVKLGIPKPTSGHLTSITSGVQRSNQEFLNGPLDTYVGDDDGDDDGDEDDKKDNDKSDEDDRTNKMC